MEIKCSYHQIYYITSEVDDFCRRTYYGGIQSYVIQSLDKSRLNFQQNPNHLPSFLTSNAYAGDTTLSWVVYSAKYLYGYVLTIFQFGDFVGGFPWLIAI